jgi:hypothetical protein
MHAIPITRRGVGAGTIGMHIFEMWRGHVKDA